jgi:hypothetical protein
MVAGHGRNRTGSRSHQAPPERGRSRYVIIRVAESFVWREFITGKESDLARATEVNPRPAQLRALLPGEQG